MYENKNFNLMKSLSVNIYIYIAAIMLLSTFLLIGDTVYGYIAAVIFVLIIIYTIYRFYNAKKEHLTKMKELREYISLSQESSILNMTIPLIILDYKGFIIWYNSKFNKIYEKDEIIGLDSSKVFDNWDFSNISDVNLSSTYKLNKRNYKLVKSKALSDEKEIFVIYFYDETEFIKLGEKYLDEKTLIMFLKVDNYDEILSDTSNEQVLFLMSEVGKFIKDWSNKYDASVQMISDDEYIVLLQKKFLSNEEFRRFTILDDMRSLKLKSKLTLTMSIGLADEIGSLPKRFEESKKSLELALGRGGDQAVIKREGNFEFFGGRQKRVERKTSVKSRMVATGLANLITESEKVYVMGHIYPDMDCYAACIGIHRAVNSLNKEAIIVLNDATDSIVELYNLFKDNTDYKHSHSRDILNKITKDDLLIVVDTHRPSITQAPEIIEKFEKRVVIDHHRRGSSIIENLSLLYQEPYASSACEMISELLQYISDDIKITDKEATVLLAGITLDTKSFVFNTSSRTFEAAAYLRRNGADTQIVKELFKDNLDDNLMKSKIVSNAKEIKKGIVISESDFALKNIKKIISQSADDLINIKDIDASFIIGLNLEDKVFVSARSNGSYNVQVILEKIGGGGHLETAGAQFEDKTKEEVKSLLLEAINKYDGGKL